MHNIPNEFVDYMTTNCALSAEEQDESLTTMRADEIIYRAKLMANLNFDKDVTANRIKKNYQWAYEFGELPSFYKSIDTLIEDVYSKSK